MPIEHKGSVRALGGRPASAVTTALVSVLTAMLSGLSAHARAQAEDCNNHQLGPCCPSVEEKPPEIPPLDKLSCQQKAHFYALFPQITTYQHLVFKELQVCAEPARDIYPEELAFVYCVPHTRQKMSVKITDLAHPKFETPVGKLNKEMILWPLTRPGDMNKLGVWQAPNIRRFDANFIGSARFSPHGGSSPQVGFTGIHNSRRFVIQINLDDPGQRFRSANSFESFIKAYVDQMSRP